MAIGLPLWAIAEAASGAGPADPIGRAAVWAIGVEGVFSESVRVAARVLSTEPAEVQTRGPKAIEEPPAAPARVAPAVVRVRAADAPAAGAVDEFR